MPFFYINLNNHLIRVGLILLVIVVTIITVSYSACSWISALPHHVLFELGGYSNIGSMACAIVHVTGMST